MSVRRTRQCRVSRAGGAGAAVSDEVVVEEPLQIRVRAGGSIDAVTVSVTMRTPGEDAELATGLLFAEGVLGGRADIAALESTSDRDGGKQTITVRLGPDVEFDPKRLSRHLLTGSSCGVCGRAALDLVWQAGVRPFGRKWTPEPETLAALAATMSSRQRVFQKTGGSHAAALFDPTGRLTLLREDIGRHNAVDKVIGALLADDALPAHNSLLAVSGRASYELVQKALVAGIPVLAAVGAPSSLAVELAAQFRMTLVGFIARDGGNVYSAEEAAADH